MVVVDVVVMSRIRIGVDPGKNGFIAIWREGKGYDFLPIPLIGKEVDYHTLAKEFSAVLFEDEFEDKYCVIEDIHAKFGASAGSTFSFGYVAGAMEMLLICSGVPYTKVAPKKWQKQMWEGVAVQQKPSSTGKTMVNDTKSTSLMAATRIFPSIDLRGNPESKRSTKPHDGKVDALLICEYCKRNF